MFHTCMENVRRQSPLIHNITNYVTVNDVANALFACGGSPVMSDDPEEVCDVTSICSGLNINIGTLSSRRLSSMLLAGRYANELGHPVVLDPVGAGSSAFRTESAYRLIREVRFAAIRGNISEIRTLARGAGTTRGVDADAADAVTEDTLPESAAFVKELSSRTGSVIAVTGALDLVADPERCYVIRNGRAEMRLITGTGCQLSAIMAAYIAANQGNALEAAAGAVCLMGLAGEKAWARMQHGEGNASYRIRLIDAIYNLTPEELEEGARYEIM